MGGSHKGEGELGSRNKGKNIVKLGLIERLGNLRVKKFRGNLKKLWETFSNKKWAKNRGFVRGGPKRDSLGGSFTGRVLYGVFAKPLWGVAPK